MIDIWFMACCYIMQGLFYVLLEPTCQKEIWGPRHSTDNLTRQDS